MNGNSNCNESSHTTIANPLIVQYTPTNPYDSAFAVTAVNRSFFQSSGSSFTNLCFYDGITEISQNVNIFPNPATDKLTITTGHSAIKSISIFNLLGENVLAVHLPTAYCQLPTSLDVSSLPPGIYFLQAKTDEGISTAKFIKSDR